MFRIIGDEIEYEYRPFARIVAPAGVLRDAATEAVELYANPEAVEERHGKEIDELENGYRDDLAVLETKITDLERERDALERELDAIEAAESLKGRLSEITADRDEWQALARRYADRIRELEAPKPRRRRIKD